MKKHASWVFVVVTLAAAPASADLTVSFATDGPAPAISASVVCGEARPPEPTTTTTGARATTATPAPSVAPVRARFVRVGDGSGESAELTLRGEDGEPGEGTLDRLSVLARPRGVDAPASLDGGDADFVAPDIRRLHAGLLPLLARLSERFPDRAIEIVSGYRPNARDGSRHRFGRALDLRVEGVPIDEVRASLDAEPETGVGLYPTSGFVHLDVRSERVRWVDDSGPGEAPRVVVSEVTSRPPRPSRPPAPAPAMPDDAPATFDADAIERAMRAADAITLDLTLPE